MRHNAWPLFLTLSLAACSNSSSGTARDDDSDHDGGVETDGSVDNTSDGSVPLDAGNDASDSGEHDASAGEEDAGEGATVPLGAGDADASTESDASADAGGDGDDDGGAGGDDGPEPPEPAFGYGFETRLPPEINFGDEGGRVSTGGFGTFIGSTFGNQFLRSTTSNVVTLTLEDLPQHDKLNLSFLFAAIDGLAGNGAAQNRLRVTLDGTDVFADFFANDPNSANQAYAAPAGVIVQRNQPLGFNASAADSVYDFAKEPKFQSLDHASDTAVITFRVEAASAQDIGDASWAIDNIVVTVSKSQ